MVTEELTSGKQMPQDGAFVGGGRKRKLHIAAVLSTHIK